MVLATLAQTGRLRHVAEHIVALQSLITLGPKHGMKMVVSRRS
jgi:hypothetical protein